MTTRSSPPASMNVEGPIPAPAPMMALSEDMEARRLARASILLLGRGSRRAVSQITVKNPEEKVERRLMCT